MIKAGTLRGKPIKEQHTGKRVAKVIDLILDEQGTRVLAIFVRENGWFTSAQMVRWRDIVEVGDALVVNSLTPVVPVHEDGEIERLLNETSSMVGAEVIGLSGYRLGMPTDVYINAAGEVVGFEVQEERTDAMKFLPRAAISEINDAGIGANVDQLQDV